LSAEFVALFKEFVFPVDPFDGEGVAMLLLSPKSTALLVDDDSLPENIYASARLFGLGLVLDVFLTDKVAWGFTQVVSVVFHCRDGRWLTRDLGKDGARFIFYGLQSQSLAKTIRDAK
jgi:hypothetical protein